jgi:hypothetical protein
MHTVLSFQLQGIPLDVAPLLQLCRSIGVHDNLYFRPLTAKAARNLHLPDWMTTVVTAEAQIITPGTHIDAHPEWVTGIVVPNPLREPRWKDDVRRPDADLYGLEEAEMLICHLGEFHPAGDGRKYAYRLERIEKTHTSEGSVYRPVARWDWADAEDSSEHN